MKSINICSAIEFFLILSISTSFIYKISGGTTILLGLFILYAIVSTKGKIPKKLTICVLTFLAFILVKSLSLTNGYVPYKPYWSIVPVIENYVQIALLIVSLSCIEQVEPFKRKIRMFIVLYHLTLIVSIIYMVLVSGYNVYRSGQATSILFIAPQVFVYYAMIISLLLFYLIMSTRNKGLIFLLVINFLFIAMSQYLTQIIFTICAIGILWVLMKVQNKLLTGILIIILSMIPFVFSDLVVLFLENMSNTMSNSPSIALRLNEIAALISGNVKNTVDLAGRFDLSAMSLDVFLKNPLFGVAFNQYNVAQVTVGGHAEWFDTLARLGIIGSVLLFLMMWQVRDVIFNFRDNSGYFEGVLIGIFIIYGFFNTFLTVYFVMIVYFSGKIKKHYAERISYER